MTTTTTLKGPIMDLKNIVAHVTSNKRSTIKNVVVIGGTVAGLIMSAVALKKTNNAPDVWGTPYVDRDESLDS